MWLMRLRNYILILFNFNFDLNSFVRLVAMVLGPEESLPPTCEFMIIMHGAAEKTNEIKKPSKMSGTWLALKK